MNGKTIAIIGACGAAGEVVTRLLSEYTGNDIIVADINLEKAKNISGRLRKNVRPVQVDVFNEAQIRNLYRMSDVVVNCAGPTVRVLDRVGRVAMQEERDYVEIGGYDYTDEKMRNEINRHRTLSYIISAGWFSGIADYLPYYSDLRADEVFDEKESMVYFAGDRGEWSDSGVSDTIIFVKKNAAQGMCIARAGRIVRALIPARSFDLPFRVPRQWGFLNMTPDLKAFALRHGEYREIRGYLILYGWRTFFTFMRIAYLLRSDEKCARALKEAYQSEIEKKGKMGIAMVEISGQKDGKNGRLWTCIQSRGEYFMTGAGCAATAMLLLKQKVKKRFGYMSESVDVPAFAATLNKLGIAISERIE